MTEEWRKNLIISLNLWRVYQAHGGDGEGGIEGSKGNLIVMKQCTLLDVCYNNSRGSQLCSKGTEFCCFYTVTIIITAHLKMNHLTLPLHCRGKLKVKYK